MISLYGVKHYYIQKDEPIVLLVIENDAISCMQPVQKILRTLLASNTPEAAAPGFEPSTPTSPRLESPW